MVDWHVCVLKREKGFILKSNNGVNLDRIDIDSIRGFRGEVV